METLSCQDFPRCTEPAVALSPGNKPGVRPPVTAARKVEAGGTGLSLVDADGVPRDAGISAQVPGPGVDELVGAFLAALEAVEERWPWASRTTIDSAHENVTVLFTDLVDWTHMSTRIDPETADRVLKRHFATLRSVVTEFDGRFVKSLGDGAMVVFRTASSALACAVAMQRAVDNDNRTSSCPLGLRVGISGGEVIRAGGDYFGDPVIEASRLCAAADAGEILVAQIVKDMAGRHVRHPCQTVGSIDLKGLPNSVVTFEVDWNPMPSRAVTPALAAPGGRAPLQSTLRCFSAEYPSLTLST